jgi:hypothetical protein
VGRGRLGYDRAIIHHAGRSLGHRGHKRKKLVMPGPVPGIHVLQAQPQDKAWMAGTSPAMTEN